MIQLLLLLTVLLVVLYGSMEDCIAEGLIESSVTELNEKHGSVTSARIDVIHATEIQNAFDPYSKYFNFSSSDSGPGEERQQVKRLGTTAPKTKPPVARGSTAPPTGIDLFWTGGDSDTSVQLSSRYTMFIYGDTLLGSYNTTRNARTCAEFFSGKKTNAACDGSEVSYMPHGSLSILDHETKEVTYHWGPDGYSFFRPPWAERHLVVFWGTAITPVLDDGDQFCIIGLWDDFSTDVANGTWTVCISNLKGNEAEPEKWNQSWSQFPGTGWNWGRFGNVDFRSSVITEGNSLDSFVYIYGAYQPLSGAIHSKQLLCRLPYAALLNGSYDGLQTFAGRGGGNGTSSGGGSEYKDVHVIRQDNGTLSADWNDAAPLYEPSAPEFTIIFSEVLNEYIVFTLPAYARYIYYRTSPTLEGPWSEFTALFNAPIEPPNEYFRTKDGGSLWKELVGNGTISCYAGKVHPSLVDRFDPMNQTSSAFSPPNSFWPPHHSSTKRPTRELFVVSYVCNTENTVRQLYADEYAQVYLPYFSFVKIEL